MVARPSQLSEGTLIDGKLRIVRRLGVGGMASVYEVEHQVTKRRCALKLLHVELGAREDVVARFLREASAAGRIGDPHIVETLDAGVLGTGEPYIVMELLEGETLADRFEHAKQLDIRELADVMHQACGAMHSAHCAGIVHRDLKPENLQLSPREGGTFVKVLDFGISKFDVVATGATGLTQDGAFLGTPHYMAPEQIRGDADVDARADVYALGVVLYEGAAGARPFHADALTALAVLIVEGRPVPLESVRTDLPAGFADVVRRAMHVDREERFATARALSDALEPFRLARAAPRAGLDRDLALAKTVGADSPGMPPQRPPRRALLAVTVVLAVVVGGGTLARSRWRTARGRDAGQRSSGDGRAGRPTAMTRIVGGGFVMSDTQRNATVAEYYLDVTEVTVDAYRGCVATGACTPANSDDPRCNGAGRLYHPINCVDYAQAAAFCAAFGKRLPTEEEWEWAARGGPKGTRFPWGDEPPGRRACWNGPGNDVGEGKRESTCPVGKFLNGTSANEVHDLAGNVWEWTASAFEGTTKRVVRGGSWHSLEPERLSASYRFRRAPDERDYVLGFRCARDVP